MNAAYSSTVNGRPGRWLPAALVVALCALLTPWRAAANPSQAVVRQGSAASPTQGSRTIKSTATTLPSNPVVKKGSATFTTQGSQLTINTTTANTLINWSSFNIGAGKTTTFIEPSSTSVVWNHISDPNPTQILGHLDANGYVVLQNQSGFFVGGNAMITVAGLLMTTTPAVPVDVFSGGAWQFSAPPPTAKIINYGEIDAGPEGSVFLISHDIENHGVITAPGGNIGLCAGEKVLISTRADGRGFSAEVTLPKGSVDNSGKLIADAGTIALNAQVVNQGGLIQANSVQERNGVIEVVASDSITLGADSTISAKGDSQGVSAGGQVTIKSGNSFSDAASSVIDVSGGAQGGAGGQVEISARQMNSIQSQINGHADPGWLGGKLLIDPVNIILSAGGSTATSGTVNVGGAPSTLTLDPSSLNSFSQILLQASGNITLASAWTVPDSATATTLTLQAGNNIIFNSSLTVGQNWSLNLLAGANFSAPIIGAPTSADVTANSKAGSSSIVLSGNSSVKSANGNITLLAGGAISTGTGAIQSTAGGSVLLQSMAQNVSLGNMVLADTATPTLLTINAVGNITSGVGITAGHDWSLSLIAGGSVTLSGAGTLQTQNGDIDITATKAVTVNTGAIRTMDGGNIDVEAITGSVNTGQNNNGYSFKLGGVSALLGGISTAAGGNVTITAGGDVTSYLPTGVNSSPTDAGWGAFGPEPGVVTITAGGSVYGHYVAADSVVNGVIVPSSITAETGNAGTAISPLALSLVKGSWIVNAPAPTGSINLQEVRNPNGTLNATGGLFNDPSLKNVFNYDPLDSVTLNAGDAVDLMGGNQVPRFSLYLVPCIYPPSLTINAGPGGVTLGDNVTLFPSPYGQLNITTSVPAGTPPNPDGTPPPGSFEGNGKTLAMSDSSAIRWIGAGTAGATDFANDHAATPVQLNDPQPVIFDIAGNLDDVTLKMPKETQITVGGNMDNVSFTGQNLHSGDVSFFHVAGAIFDQSTYAFVDLGAPLTLPPALYKDAQQNYLQLLTDAVVPGSGQTSANGGALFPNLELFYIPSTHQLGYYGVMDAATEALLLGPLQEITYSVGGLPNLNANGTYNTTTATLPASLSQAIQALYAASQNSIGIAKAPQGIVIGGPGQLDVTAQSMDLGVSTSGISSEGPDVNNSLAKIASQGANISIYVAGDLDLYASVISSWYGGAITINAGGTINAGLAGLPLQQANVTDGIWTSGDSAVTVKAGGDINVAGSRIAAFNGGDVVVESYTGNVNCGIGASPQINVSEIAVNPKTDAVTTLTEGTFGSGIIATTFADAPPKLEVGNITVSTPQGDIDAALGGIRQQAQNGNTSLAPTVKLTAGTFGPNKEVIYTGNINAQNSGVIDINTDASATGNVNGLFISSGSSSIYGNNLNVTVQAGQNVSLGAAGTITGTVIAGGAVNVGSGSFSGVAFAQSVSGGGATSSLATAATATAGSQTSAAGEATLQKTATSDQPVSTDADEDLKRHPRPLLAKFTGRVTVLLPPKL